LGYIGTGDDFSSGNNYSDFWEYDPFLNTWIQIEDFAGTARRYLTSFVIGSRAYVGTGTNGTNFRDFWMFDQILSVLNRNVSDFNVALFPNPSQNEINVQLDNLPVTIPLSALKFELIDIYGKTQISEQLLTENSKYNIEGIGSGIYIYRLTYDQQVFKSGKFVKN
jgi:hypothetical protein